jgi:DNA-binding NarL/FixJ family response regulator
MSRLRGALQVIRASYRLHGTHDEWLSTIAARLARVASTRAGGISVGFWIAPHESHPLNMVARQFHGMGARCVSLIETGFLGVSGITKNLHARVQNSINFVVFEPEGEGCAFVFPKAEAGRLHTRTRQSCQRILVHVAAGLRLRRLRVTEILDAVASVLGRDEREELEAAFAQSTWSVRDILRRLALSVDSALARRDDGNEDLAREVYQGVFEGRWTLIDHFHDLASDRRFVIARRVEAEGSAPLRLTPAEREVLRRAMEWSGDNHEGIARKMNRSESHVSNHLSRALEKLGVRNRAELMAAFPLKFAP